MVILHPFCNAYHFYFFYFTLLKFNTTGDCRMLTYLDYTLYSLRGNRALCGYTNTSLPVTTVTTNMARKDNDKIVFKSLRHNIFDIPFIPMDRGN